jgi:hypothetical protein
MVRRDPVVGETGSEGTGSPHAEGHRQSRIRDWYEGSLAQDVVRRLALLDFSNQIVLFGAGLLVSLVPFLILLR